MKNYFITVCFIIYNPLQITFADVADRNGIKNAREDRKLFGGYRITPKFCKSTRPTANPPAAAAGGAANICMFNFECSQRGGQVVGACMDGFLFGTCCQLPESAMIGDFLSQDYPGVSPMDNKLSSKIIPTTHRTTPMYDITSHGVSQIAASLLHGNPPFSGDGNAVPTANDNTIQIQAGLDNNWSTGGVTHSGADTVVNDEDNDISSSYFSSSKLPNYTSKKPTTPYGNHEETTMRYAESYPPPILQISVSNAPVGYTPLPTIQRPMFRPKPPKPTDENYILIPTLTHESNKPNKTEDNESVAIDVNLINHSTSSRPLTTFSYVSSSSTPSNRKSTSKKPPSTSYVYSTTIPPRRTESTTSRKPIKSTITSSKPPSTSYVYSSTFRPTSPKPPNNVYSSSSRPLSVAHSTFASTPEGFPGSSTPSFVSSSSYRPSTVSSNIAGPGFTVTSQPVGHYSSYPTPAPTVIVLAPISDDSDKNDDGYVLASSSSRPTLPTRIGTSSTTTTSQPPPSQFPQRKPVNHVTINNHVTQNIYSTQRPQTSSSATNQNPPLPTVIITPKPTISSTSVPLSVEEADLESVVITSTNDLNDFPPDRNPNLNLSVPVLNDDDITTPSFVEDDAMNETVESFVNQIIYGLQKPFNDLKDIVYNKKNATTTKKPATTTKKPAVTKPNAVKVTTRRPIVTTKRPASGVTIKTPTTTTTRRPPSVTLTTIQNYIETETEAEIQQSYRDQCGLRPLLRNGRIVGGRGAQIGEFPWQVLVRESTWLGLLTKNKCGGVLISEKYVITAAHCQPGFLASLVAVFGEYDISGDLETRKPVSRNVKRVIVHRKYDAATFENDLALLELESAVKFDAHIIPICLPPDNTDYAKRMATVTGWGRLKYGGGVPSVLQEVQVPIMENSVCQDMFRTAGHSKVILDSFLCAGYANGQKDACEGDSGGPLVVQRPDGRYELAGTVSHGIKCAAPYLPGVYMRTTYYKPWITSITGLE